MNKSRNKILDNILLFVILFVLFLPSVGSAFTISTYDNMQVYQDLILGPGKVELSIAPGKSAEREMMVTNRTGQIMNIFIDIEDFTGDSANTTKLLGNEKGPYSLKDYIIPEKTSFQLAHGEKATLPITIKIPQDAEPGGLYGAAIVRAEPISEEKNEDVQGAKGQVSVVSRLAQLYFVRVEGDVKEEGKLKSFTANKKFFQKTPVDFSVVYENTGRVHLNPYAKIEIKNFLGKKVDEIEMSPWFVMPGFDRTKDVSWAKTVAFGRYTAELKINRGYGNIIDEAKISFWIIPIKVLLIGLTIIVLLAIFIWWFLSKFEFKKKGK